MNQSNKNLMIGAFVFVFSASLIGCDLINSPKKETKKVMPAQSMVESGPLSRDVVARVGAWSLTTEQFAQRLKILKEGMPDFDENKPGNKESVLNELVRQQLLVKDAEDLGISAQPEVTEAVEDFRRTLMVQELASRLTKDIVANEKEAQEYYDQNKDLFVEPIEWKVREIVVGDEAIAKTILGQVLQGGDFAAIAQAQSKGKTAAEGGILPNFARAPFAAMQTSIAAQETGGTTGVFKGPEGYYIVKVDEKKGGAMKSFSDVKKDLIEGLTLRKQQEVILKHIDALSAKTKVEINKELFGSAGK